jgi:hypothetical protein
MAEQNSKQAMAAFDTFPLGVFFLPNDSPRHIGIHPRVFAGSS